jgi:hypothetical protein
MKRGPTVLPALLFGTLSVLTFYVYVSAWHMSMYWILLSSLAALSGVLGTIVLMRARFSWSACLGVGLGLLVGQWWVVEFALAQILWHLRGFAP